MSALNEKDMVNLESVFKVPRTKVPRENGGQLRREREVNLEVNPDDPTRSTLRSKGGQLWGQNHDYTAIFLQIFFFASLSFCSSKKRSIVVVSTSKVISKLTSRLTPKMDRTVGIHWVSHRGWTWTSERGLPGGQRGGQPGRQLTWYFLYVVPRNHSLSRQLFFQKGRFFSTFLH